MDINSIILLNEEQKLAAARMNESADSIQPASAHAQTVQVSLDFLSTATTYAHAIGSTTLDDKASAKPFTAPEAPQTPPKTPSTGGVNPAATGGSPAGPNFPPPTGDTNEGPPVGDPTVPNGANSDYGTQGYLNKLNNMIMAMNQVPDNMAQGQIFLQYLLNLGSAGLLNDPLVQGELNSMDGKAAIALLISQNADLAYFQGFNGQVGDAGATAFLQNLYSQVQSAISQGGDNSYLDAMSGDLMALAGTFSGGQGKSIFDQNHYDAATGQYYWTSGLTHTQYFWDPTQDGSSGNNQMIYKFIATGSAQTGGPAPYWDSLNFNIQERNYRMELFNQLVTSYKDPSVIITLFIMMAYGNEGNYQLTGFTDATDTENTLTTNYVTPLTDLFGEVGTSAFGQAQATQLINDMNQSTDMINSMHSTENLASNWTTNFYQYFMNTSVTFKDTAGNTVTDTLGNILAGGGNGGGGTGSKYQMGDFLLAMNQLAPSPTTGSGTPGTPPSALQPIENAVQQAGALVTQQSKTLNTESASVSNVIDQVTKIANFYTDSSSNGGGIGALEQYLTSKQISN